MSITRTRKSQLPKTGWTVPYDGEGFDDGGIQAGSPILPRFIDNGDNTITDRVTNRQWIKQPELIIPDGLRADNIGQPKGFWVSGGPYAAGDIVTDSSDNSAWICLIANTHTNVTSFAAERTANPTYWSATASIWAVDDGSGNLIPSQDFVWSNEDTGKGATDSCKGLTKSGKSDWYLPNRFELESILDLSQVRPTINSTIFPNTRTDNYYWTSSPYAGDPGSVAWIVFFDDGGVSSNDRGGYGYVRPVRQY